MAQPTAYNPATSFTNHSTNYPTTPHSGTALDTEFAAIETTTDQIRTNMALLQRDDGALANLTVGNDQLKPEVELGFNSVTTWATTTAYRVRDGVWRAADDARVYRCVEAHTSGTFSTDLAAGYWTLVVDLQTSVTAAAASATTASGHATTASGHATTASGHADTASAAAAAAAASYDAFDDRYLGAKSSNPTLDNDGNALATGALYWNTSASNLRVYDGAAWQAIEVLELASQAEAEAGSENGKASTPLRVFQAFAAKLATANTWTKGQIGAVVALTDASTIAVDLSLGNNFSVTLGDNRTLGNPTNAVAGQSGIITITQDGTGSRTLSYAANWEFAGATAPVLTTTASRKDCLAYYVVSATEIWGVLTKDVR